MAKITKGEIVAIDGKALRGSRDGEKSAIYVVSAWANANGIVLVQMKVNEIAYLKFITEFLTRIIIHAFALSLVSSAIAIP